MNLTVETGFLINVLLISIRFSGVFLMTPLFAVGSVPVRIRVMLVLSLATFIVMTQGLTQSPVQYTTGELLNAAASEMLIGLVLAFGVFAAFAAFLFGGRILDFQMGFGVANLIDPSTNTQGPLIGTVLNFIAVITFFLVDGHHMLIKGLAYSIERVPPGIMLAELPLAEVLAQFGAMFVYGLAVVAPAIFALLLLDVGMAVVARTMPQMNIFIVGIPLKIFVGLVVLAISLNYMGPLLERIYSSIFHYWEAALA